MRPAALALPQATSGPGVLLQGCAARGQRACQVRIRRGSGRRVQEGSWFKVAPRQLGGIASVQVVSRRGGRESGAGRRARGSAGCTRRRQAASLGQAACPHCVLRVWQGCSQGWLAGGRRYVIGMTELKRLACRVVLSLTVGLSYMHVCVPVCVRRPQNGAKACGVRGSLAPPQARRRGCAGAKGSGGAVGVTGGASTK
jgi:hypothetical protein